MAKFAEGDRVDWAQDADPDLVREVGPGPFIVRGVEAAEPKGDHCQWIALRKEVDGQLFCWASHQDAWIPDHDGPPYIASPPVFSNTAFRRVA